MLGGKKLRDNFIVAKMSGHTKRDKIRNLLEKKVRMASIVEEMIETHVRGFGHA